MKKYSKRIEEALKKIPSCSKVYDAYDEGDFVEVTVNRWGDTCTYRVYNDGDICEE